MDTALFSRRVKATEKAFAPRGHFIEEIRIEDGRARLRIVPRPGFSGEPEELEMEVSEDEDAIMRAMMRAGFFMKVFDPVP